MSKVRGIRFNNKEESLVEEFLNENPLIDFTTLAKIAILEFVKRPQITLRPVLRNQKTRSKNVRAN